MEIFLEAKHGSKKASAIYMKRNLPTYWWNSPILSLIFIIIILYCVMLFASSSSVP